jgi:arylsulfatase
MKTALRHLLFVACILLSAMAIAQQKKPNILVIMADDVGDFNLSSYNMGRMGYRTPNIDKIAQEGALFTDFYAQNSCTAGRAAFITGQSPIRTGLLKVGIPRAPEGIKKEEPTIAELLKPFGYKTIQLGKNHLGDLDEMLPTNHGFDEFYGILYHLDGMEDRENPEFPKDSAFLKKYGSRGIIHSFAGGKIEDLGPLTKKHMETFDNELAVMAMNYLDKAKKDGSPFFMYYNTTRMHLHTHLSPEAENKTGLGIFADGMVEHDALIGQILARLKANGQDQNTIVVYVSDNGAETYTWPDGSTTMFRGEKNTQWEGGFRSPCLIRWPGVIKPGTVNNEITSLEDFLPTLVSAAGDAGVKEKLLTGYQANGKTFKVHLDGYNLMPALKGETTWPRNEFFYWTDDGGLAATRVANYKMTFLRQDHVGAKVWFEPFTHLRQVTLTNLRMDPFELAQDVAVGYELWSKERTFVKQKIGDVVGGFMQTFLTYPPRQKPGSFNVDQMMEGLYKTSEKK